MGKFVGIDLGTTFSVISYIDAKGNPVLIENDQGAYTTPSVVLFEDGNPIIGNVAKKKSFKNPANFESFVKRHMAERSYKFTTKEGNSYTPEEISALILRKLKENAEARMGESVDGAVITVPAYFGDSHRQATKDAAKIAGIKVLDIINEPTAAAIAFGVSKNIENKLHVMIYDFGGGTFDTSVLEIDAGNITVIATNGDHKLGGFDIDKKIIEYVTEEGLKHNIDVKSDPKAKQALQLEAEKAKIELSGSKETEITVYVKGEELTVTLTREEFEDRIESIADTTISIMQQTLNDVNMDYSDLDKILLVGGSTRIPFIRAMIEEESGIKPSAEVNPDEAVSIGAAYYAVECAKKIASGEMSNEDVGTKQAAEGDIPEIENAYTFSDVTSHSIGIAVLDEVLDKEVNRILLKKNTKIPVEVSEDGFSTVQPYQEGIHLKITQGEREDLDYVTIIGEADIKVRPRETQVPISFTVSCDSGAIIHVTAVDEEDHINLGEITINREKHNMSESQVNSAALRVNKLDIG